jgi:putative endonuclease
MTAWGVCEDLAEVQNPETILMRTYYVYILASAGKTLYVGVTNNLQRRVLEHKQGLHDGFTKRYNAFKLVHVETASNIRAAILCEKRLKWWQREWKIKLIETTNPGWLDLAADWYEDDSKK